MRVNANAADALGTGTVTMTGSANSISGATAGVFNISNPFVLNPSNAANFVAGFTAAGATAGTTQLNFTGNISGSSDVYVVTTTTPTNTDSNGNGLTVFSGTNTYTGATVLNMASVGSFRLGSAGALPGGTSITFGRG